MLFINSRKEYKEYKQENDNERDNNAKPAKEK